MKKTQVDFKTNEHLCGPEMERKKSKAHHGEQLTKAVGFWPL